MEKLIRELIIFFLKSLCLQLFDFCKWLEDFFLKQKTSDRFFTQMNEWLYVVLRKGFIVFGPKMCLCFLLCLISPEVV